MLALTTEERSYEQALNLSVYEYRWTKYAKVLTFAKGISNTM